MARQPERRAMSERPQQIRVFLSSPGDVADERALARRLLKEELPYDPFLRGRVAFDIVSWDDPAAPVPMDAALTPQEAVNRFGPKPSESPCCMGRGVSALSPTRVPGHAMR